MCLKKSQKLQLDSGFYILLLYVKKLQDSGARMAFKCMGSYTEQNNFEYIIYKCYRKTPNYFSAPRDKMYW